jgi:Flp pilus assembly protein TadD
MKMASLWLISCLLCLAQTPAAEEKLQAGLRAQRASDIPGALASFADAVRLDPKLAPARVYLGASLLASGRMAEAIVQLERAAELLPDDVRVRQQLAAAYVRSSDFMAAVMQLRKAAELAPRDSEVAYQLGRAYLRLSEWSVERMKNVNPNSARVYQVLGESYSAQGAPEKAVEAFEKAAKAEPGLSGTHLAIAYVYARAGKTAEARQEIDRELAVSPGSVAAVALLNHLGTQP